MSSFTFYSFAAFLLLLCLSTVSGAPIVVKEAKGPTVPNAGGLALSADGTVAFVFTTLTTGGAVYAIPVPINGTTNQNPTPYFTNPSSGQYYYIAASVPTTPQMLYLIDNQNALLVSLAYTPVSPPNNTVTVLSFGIANQDLVNGMYLQPSTGLIFLSLYDHFGGATFDYVGMVNPTAATPTLTTLYTTSFSSGLAGILVSSSYLYFGIYTAVVPTSSNVASVWQVPVTYSAGVPSVSSSAVAVQIYQTTNANLANITGTSGTGNSTANGLTTYGYPMIYPSAFQMNAQGTILYVTDIGNQDAQAASTPHQVYGLWPLTYGGIVPQLNTTNLYSYLGVGTEIQQNFALSPDGGTVYFAATGSLNGLYYITNANTSIVNLGIPAAPITPTAGPATSAPLAPTSAVVPPTSAVVSPTSPVVRPTSAVVPPTSAVVPPTSAVVPPTSAVVSPTSTTTTTKIVPSGTVTVSSSFSFSDPGDALSCLASNPNGTIGFAASDGGDIYTWSLLSAPTTISPTYIAGTGSSGASFIDCQSDPTGTLLYLLDTRNALFYVWNAATPTVAPAVVSSFPNEISQGTGTMISFAIDFVNQYAYLGTRQTDFIYAITLTPLGQSNGNFYAFQAPSDVTSMFVSNDQSLLYFGYPAPAEGSAGGIASTSIVPPGSLNYISSPTVVVSSVNIIFPDAIWVNGSGVGTTLYFKDGGAFRGQAGPTANTLQTINAVNIATSALTVLFSTTTINLPPGLVETSPLSVARVAPYGVTSLIFTEATSISFITLVNGSVPVTPPTATPTSAAATSALRTSAPATSPLVTSAAATSPLITSAPATSPLVTSAAATSALRTSAPATSPLVTSAPATSPLVTSAPATSPLVTSAPATSPLVTSAPATSPLVPATSPLVTSAPATSPLITSAPATSPLVTSAAATSPLVPATSPLVTSAAATSALRTSAPATSPLVTSAAATSPLVTSAPATSPLVTSAPVTSTVAAPTATTGTGRVVGDPMFVGFLRQRYQVHGMDGVVYNILSQASVSINALFVFLESGACPVVDGVKATNCWSHPGSYFGSLSMQTSSGDELEIVAGGATTGFSAVRFDGEAVRTVKGVEGKGAALSFQMLSTHAMSITIDNYRLVIENSDLFVNLVSIEVLDWQQLASVDQPHGLLGQTWKPSKKGRGGQVVAVKDVAEGDVDDYVIASDSIFGTDFLYNKFQKSE